MNYAPLEVYEAHGVTACDGLSAAGYVPFYLEHVAEAGPDWDTFNNAASLVSWTGVAHTGTPECYWGAFLDVPYWTEVTWSP